MPVALLAPLLGGCLLFYLPDDPGTPHGLRDRSEDRLPPTVLQPGVATRESVLCALGIPDRVLDDGRAMLWVGSSVVGNWILVLGGYNSAGAVALPVGSDYLLLVEFDDAGRVVRDHFRSTSLRGFHAALPELYASIGRDDAPRPR